ncbi:HEAT repeat domain-containing protein [Kitasatospora sp. NPDC051853]|uniref:HEAT repeat domain-containing protein n=1 Tax=Kitasatospora sp. NPDC051853 TaxID=3364058 RepID=UPI0037906975
MPDLSTAITAFDARAVERALHSGADPLAPGPDGVTPLRLAVESGSPLLVSTLLDRQTRERLSPGQREHLLAVARSWYERDVAALGPFTWVEDEQDSRVQQLVLDGRTVRAGHGAVLTWLEQEFGVPVPADELIARAVRQSAEDHPDRVGACGVLSRRQDPETWTALWALRPDPNPARRLVLAVVLGYRAVVDDVDDPAMPVAWAREETDARVLSEVLFVCGLTVHEELGAIGVRYAGHPDPDVRCQVPELLGASSPAEVSAMLALADDTDWKVRNAAAQRLAPERAAEYWSPLLTLLHDPVLRVRLSAALALGHSNDPRPEIGDLLRALLEEDDRELREIGGYGLAMRQDDRAFDAYRRLGPYSEADGGWNPHLEHLRRWVEQQERSRS